MTSPLFPRAAVSLALLVSTVWLSAAPSLPAGHTVTERGSHHRVVQWFMREQDKAGNERVLTNSVTELASGIHYPDERGVFQESVAEFVRTKDGFVAARGPHQVALARDLQAAGAVTLVTPEGQTLRSTPTLLAYVDRVTGESVRLADLKPSKGELVAPDTVIYADAFDSVDADVRAIYAVGSFEFDVVLRQQLPDPAKFGLVPERVDLAVYTEYFDTRPTAKHAQEQPGKDGEPLADVRLDFGSMVMARGKSYAMEAAQPADGSAREEVDVRKEWVPIEGRDFLVERTAYLDLAPLLKGLPEAAAPSPEQLRRADKFRRTAKLDLPIAPASAATVWPRTQQGRLLAAGSADFPVRSTGERAAADLQPATSRPATALAASSRPGVVLDYVIIFTSTTGFTFDSLTTYLINGMVNISGGPVDF